MKSTLYIIFGLPFSGKTTLASEISKTKNVKAMAFDWVWAEIKGDLVPDMDKIKEREEIWDICFDRLKNELQLGNSVVFEDVCLKKEIRDRLRNIAEEAGSEFKLIYLDIPLEILQERRANNLITKERHHVASINLRTVLEQFEYPTIEEGVMCLTEKTDSRQFIDSI